MVADLVSAYEAVLCHRQRLRQFFGKRARKLAGEGRDLAAVYQTFAQQEHELCAELLRSCDTLRSGQAAPHERGCCDGTGRVVP